MSNKPLKKDFSSEGKSLVSPATLHEALAASTVRTFDPESDDPAPRAIRCDAAGVVEFTDINDITVAYNVLQSEIIPFDNIKEITANTTIALQLWW